MSRRRFFVDEVRGGYAELSGEEADHLARVLRAQPGQVYELSDNRGLYLAEVESAGRRVVRFRVREQLPSEPESARVTVLAALVKFDRFEWMVEKATEMGASAIVPVAAARSDKGLEAAAAKRVERWRRIAREASQQSRRARLPWIADPVRLERAAGEAAGLRIYLEELPGSPPLARAVAGGPAEVTLAVGPEGGWTLEERGVLAGAGFQTVTLGPSILRAETAALAAVAIVTHLVQTAAIK